jgi:hypothetical protein
MTNTPQQIDAAPQAPPDSTGVVNGPSSADNADTGTPAEAAVGPARNTESYEVPKRFNDALSQIARLINVMIADNPAPAEDTTTGKQVGIPVDSETLDLIQRLATMQGVSEATALKKALTEAEFFYNTVQDGGRLLVEKKNKTFADIKLKVARDIAPVGIQ